jgi:glycosyltransferase involved in cell wall biosynthesis
MIGLPPASVSIVIPAFNAAGTVEAAVHSMLSQSLAPFEVIVVDDGSTDGTYDVLASFGDSIRVIRQPNSGLAASRTVGQRAATGTYVAWMDADDIALPHRLAVQYAVMSAEPSVVVASGDFDIVEASGDLHPRAARKMYGALGDEDSLEQIFGGRKHVDADGRRWSYFSGDAHERLALGNFLHPPVAMVRRSATERIGPLNGDFRASEDWLYFVELSRYGNVAFIDEPLLQYRSSPTQMTSSLEAVAVNNLRSLEFVLSRYPTLEKQRPQAVARARAARHHAVAYAFSETDRRLALRHLALAVRAGGPSMGLAKALARILLPSRALDVMRFVRDGLR